MKNTIGRKLPVREAFNSHLLRAIDEIIPCTPALIKYSQRPRERKIVEVQGRLIDDAEKILQEYHKNNNGSQVGANAPFPVVLIAYAKDFNPITSDRGRSITYKHLLKLGEEDGAPSYPCRMSHKEWRCQLSIMAHESESAAAIADQIVLYLDRFENQHFPINWCYNNIQFPLTGMLEDYQPMVSNAEMAERSNITVLVMDFTLNFQIPYITSNEVSKVQKVDVTVNPIQVKGVLGIGSLDDFAPKVRITDQSRVKGGNI